MQTNDGTTARNVHGWPKSSEWRRYVVNVGNVFRRDQYAIQSAVITVTKPATVIDDVSTRPRRIQGDSGSDGRIHNRHHEQRRSGGVQPHSDRHARANYGSYVPNTLQLNGSAAVHRDRQRCLGADYDLAVGGAATVTFQVTIK